MIRLAKTEEADELADLINSAYRGESSKMGWTTEAEFLDGQRTDAGALRELISDKNNAILVVGGDGNPTACVYLRRKTDRAYLGMLTVKPDLQASGIGRRLLASAEQWVMENWQLRRIEMTVIQKRAELIAWYKRRGYLNTRKTEPFPYGKTKFGVPKVDDLEFAVLEKTLK